MVWANISAEHEVNARRLSDDDTDWAYVYVKASEDIYKGSLVEYETGNTGYVVPAQDQGTFAGVAMETLESATAGDQIKVYIKGDFEFIKGTPAVTDCGRMFYASTTAYPHTVDNTGTNPVGFCVDYKTANVVIRIDGYANGLTT